MPGAVAGSDGVNRLPRIRRARSARFGSASGRTAIRGPSGNRIHKLHQRKALIAQLRAISAEADQEARCPIALRPRKDGYFRRRATLRQAISATAPASQAPALASGTITRTCPWPAATPRFEM
jgi:hypothetical protein